MKTTTIARSSLGLVAAAALTITGCGSTASPGSAAPAPAAAAPAAAATEDPAVALGKAAAKLGEESFAMAMTMGEAGGMNGSMDPVKKVSQFTMNVEEAGSAITMEMRTIGDDLYMKTTAEGLDLPGGNSWTHMEQGDAAGPMSLGTFDPAEVAATLERTSDVKRVGDKDFTGTVDLAASAEALGMTAADVEAVGATPLPFEASVDDEGRLVRYAFTSPAVSGQPPVEMVTTYSDFGLPVDVQAPPAAEVQEMPGG